MDNKALKFLNNYKIAIATGLTEHEAQNFAQAMQDEQYDLSHLKIK